MHRELKGIAASPGIATGKIFVFEKAEAYVSRETIAPEDTAAELLRFTAALDTCRAELERLIEHAKAGGQTEQAEILGVQLTVLDDPTLTDGVAERINGEQKPAGWALSETVTEICEMFAAIDDEYLRERVFDVKDVCGRLARVLSGGKAVSLSSLPGPAVVVARDLLPSDTVAMDMDNILGFATDAGGRTSHTSIIARSLEIPAVVGLGSAFDGAADGGGIIIDGTDGVVIMEPSTEQLAAYARKKQLYDGELRLLAQLKELPAETADGKRVELCANIGSVADIAGANKYGAEGIGLFRTEFLYMDSAAFPTEEQQFAAYREAAEKINGAVIIRTLDIGGDKSLPYYKFPDEENPFLGLRAIRFCLANRPVFKTQLRAILRASSFGRLRIMFPMIISVEEFIEARAVLSECMNELRQENIPFDEQIEVGIMVETPAVAAVPEHFAEICDFFSIGTNDLTQYVLAVDRGNKGISELYNPLHPAVIASIKRIIDASHRFGKWTGMCGELAGDERAAKLLLGMGLDEFSMSAASIPRIKNIIRSASFTDAKKTADEALRQKTWQNVAAALDIE